MTGTASAIGRAIALGIGASGGAVGCFDLPGPGLAETVGRLGSDGVDAIAVAGDTDVDALRAAVRTTEQRLGPLSLAVNIAGVADAAPAEELALGLTCW